MTDEGHHQIGQVADRVGLSLRTIRYWEEIGLVTPSGRTEGGFRLYTEDDIERLRTVKALKPIGMSLETMRELLQLRDHLVNDGGEPEDSVRFRELLGLAQQRCEELAEQLAAARLALARMEQLPQSAHKA